MPHDIWGQRLASLKGLPVSIQKDIAIIEKQDKDLAGRAITPYSPLLVKALKNAS